MRKPPTPRHRGAPPTAIRQPARQPAQRAYAGADQGRCPQWSCAQHSPGGARSLCCVTMYDLRGGSASAPTSPARRWPAEYGPTLAIAARSLLRATENGGMGFFSCLKSGMPVFVSCLVLDGFLRPGAGGSAPFLLQPWPTHSSVDKDRRHRLNFCLISLIFVSFTRPNGRRSAPTSVVPVRRLASSHCQHAAPCR
jgi:hypothetical protein